MVLADHISQKKKRERNKIMYRGEYIFRKRILFCTELLLFASSAEAVRSIGVFLGSGFLHNETETRSNYNYTSQMDVRYIISLYCNSIMLNAETI